MPPENPDKKSWKKKDKKIDIVDSNETAISLEVTATKPIGGGSYGKITCLKGRKLPNGGKLVKKTLRLDTDDYDEQKQNIEFENETKILKHLGQLRGTRRNNNKLTLYMDYEGKNLLEVINKQRLNKAKTLSSSEIINIMGDCLYSLVTVHALNIIHSDIKPQNIAYSRSKQEAKLLDYGLSRFVHQGGVCGGTPEVSAPEVVLKGQPQTQAADVYSMGITLMFFLERIFSYPPGTLLDKIIPFARNPQIHHRLIFNKNKHADNLKAILKFDLKLTSAQSETYADVLMRMVDEDPAKRPSASEAQAIFVETFASHETKTNNKQKMDEIDKKIKSELYKPVCDIIQTLSKKHESLLNDKTNATSQQEATFISGLLGVPEAPKGSNITYETFYSLKKHIEDTFMVTRVNTNQQIKQNNSQDLWQLHKQKHIQLYKETSYTTLKTDVNRSFEAIKNNKLVNIKTEFPHSFSNTFYDFIKGLISFLKPVGAKPVYSTATTLTNVENTISHQIKRFGM